MLIPEGEYWWQYQRVGFQSARKRPLIVGFDYLFGEFYDGDKDSYIIRTFFKPIRYVGLELNYTLDQVRLPAGNFDSRLASARLQLTITPDLAWYNLLQYDNESESIGYNSRIRWEFRPGAQLFLVLNQAIDRNHSRLRWERTEAMVKVGMSFRF